MKTSNQFAEVVSNCCAWAKSVLFWGRYSSQAETVYLRHILIRLVLLAIIPWGSVEAVDLWISPNPSKKIVNGVAYNGSIDVKQLFFQNSQGNWTFSRGKCRVVKLSDTLGLYGLNSADMGNVMGPFFKTNNLVCALETYDFNPDTKSYSSAIPDLAAFNLWKIPVGYLINSGGDKGIFFAVRTCGLTIPAAVAEYVKYVNAAHAFSPLVQMGEILPFSGSDPGTGFSLDEVKSILSQYALLSGTPMSVCEFEPYPVTAKDYVDFKSAVDYAMAEGTLTGIILHGISHNYQSGVPSREQIPTNDQTWNQNVLADLTSCQNLGIIPNFYNLQSWLEVPRNTLSEWTPSSFTNTVVDLFAQLNQ